MGRFKKVTSGAAGAAAPPADAAPTVTDLSLLTTMSPLPLGGMTTIGRVTFLFGNTEGALTHPAEGSFVVVGKGWASRLSETA